MTEGRQFQLLFRIHLRIARSRLARMLTEARLMTATLTAFLVIYNATAYLLFRRGLVYFGQLPAAGSLLVDRMIQVVFFCFLVMLIFSVAVSAYIALYRSRDSRWLLTLPVSHRVLFLWKLFEAGIFSSWGLILISAPLLVAFAEFRGAGPAFYLRTVAALLPFLVIAIAGGGGAMILVVRWLERRHLQAIGIILAAAILVWLAAAITSERDQPERSGFSAAMTFQQVMRHTNLSANRLLPSTWLSNCLLDWSRSTPPVRPLLFPSLLASWALMGGLIAVRLGRRWFYESWQRSLQNAAHAQRRALARSGARAGGARLPSCRIPLLEPLIGRPLAALCRKDVVSFRREPAQWIQFLIVFGLLSLYASGLRSLNQHLEQPRDLFLVAMLNLAVCALALSTLTTRFVFPQFSLEGRRLWILAMSPLPLARVIVQKFLLSTTFTSLAVAVIILISGNTLNLRASDTAFFTSAMLMLSISLNAIAVGLGVLFPVLDESNSAKIVSGFGGTLCLIVSFGYIVLFLLLLTWGRFDVFRKNELPDHWLSGQHAPLALSLACVFSAVATWLPLKFATKRLKRLEILGSL